MRGEGEEVRGGKINARLLGVGQQGGYVPLRYAAISAALFGGALPIRNASSVDANNPGNGCGASKAVNDGRCGFHKGNVAKFTTLRKGV